MSNSSSAPKPRPVPAPVAKPGQLPVQGVVHSAPVVNDAEFNQAKAFGRVDENGIVWVKEGQAERSVGQVPGETSDAALELYVRRYLDLLAQVRLFEARFDKLNARELETSLAKLEEQVKEPAAVGDLPALRERVAQLAPRVKERKEKLAEERAKAREDALEQRELLVLEAERLSAQDPQRTQWRNTSEQLLKLLEQWKGLQSSGPRLERSIEEALWKRFAAARSTFEKNRKVYFAQLDASRSEAKRAKEKLIEQAEKLADSTDWGATAAAFRGLMDQWKAAGRASHKDDDALWQRFHAAQQRFYDARRANAAQLDAEFQGNLEAKLALVEKAEALLPVSNIEEFKAALRPIQEEWDKIGRTPRQGPNVEARMREVENALRAAEEEEWSRTNPETKARAAGLVGQLQDQIEGLERDLEKAKAKANEKKICELEEGLKARKAWLEQLASF